MDAATGKTRWEYAYNANFGNLAMENGAGPHVTPLILSNRVYTVGVMAMLKCFDKTTGKRLWSKDLYKDFPGASRMDRGYSSSPMAYKVTAMSAMQASIYNFRLSPENRPPASGVRHTDCT